MTSVLIALCALAAGAVISVAVSPNRSFGLAAGIVAVVVAGAACVVAAAFVLNEGSRAAGTLQWPLPLGTAHLGLDGLSAWFLLCVGIVAPASAVYSWGYFEGGKTANRAYAPLMCALVAAIVLVVCAADVVAFLVGWEIMSLSAFFLVGLSDQVVETRHGAWMYLVATHIGTALGVTPVLGAFVAKTGGTELNAFVGAFNQSDSWIWVTLFILGVAGFGTKAGLMPFHIWLPAAHPVAPSPVSALMSAVVIKSGIYGLLRLISWMPSLSAGYGIGLIVISLVTALMGILYAVGQRQLKRMLAYSSVENIGVIGLSIGLALLGRSLHQPMLVAFGIGGALLHVLNHSLFKGLLFLSAGSVLHATGTGDIERLGGLAHKSPSNSLMFVVGSVAICALPPLNGFVSEYLIYNGLLRQLGALPMGYSLLLALSAAILAISGGIALVAFSKVVGVVFLGEPRDPTVHAHEIPFSMRVAMYYLAVACAGVVAMPGAVTSALSHAIPSVMSDAGALSGALEPALGNIASLSLSLGLLLVCAAALFGVRQLLPAGEAVGGSGGTWGCGYPAPTASMQYTGSSYAWKVLDSLRQLARTRRRAPEIAEYFPRPAACDTDTPDWVLTRLYSPLFRRISRACEALWPLQHGRVQLYLIYIVLTALSVFMVELWQMSANKRADEDHSVDAPTRPVAAAREVGARV